MSGFLGALGGLLDDLFGASFRGVEFHMPDSRHETGRRVQRFFFPGLDQTVHEDLGAFDGGIQVTGLVIGDDYIAQARALDRAFRKAGPGLLVHPWLGEIEVVLAKPASITFSHKELRVARFEALFEPWRERAPAPLDTLSGLLDAIQDVRAQVRSMLRQVLAPVRLTVLAIGAVQGFVSGTASTWRGLMLASSSLSPLARSTGPAFMGLASVASIPSGVDYGGVVADRLDLVPQALAAAAAPPLPAVVGPAADAPPAEDVADPAEAATALLAAAEAFAADPAALAAVPALPFAAATLARAAAVSAALDIPFASRDEAIAWRDRVDAALAAAATAAELLALTAPLAAGPVWRAIAALRSAVAADFNDRIGRLPAVAVLADRGGTVPAWLIAQHLAGDDPTAVVAVLNDLVARNRLVQPGAVPPDQRIEYLSR